MFFSYGHHISFFLFKCLRAVLRPAVQRWFCRMILMIWAMSFYSFSNRFLSRSAETTKYIALIAELALLLSSHRRKPKDGNWYLLMQNAVTDPPRLQISQPPRLLTTMNPTRLTALYLYCVFSMPCVFIGRFLSPHNVLIYSKMRLYVRMPVAKYFRHIKFSSHVEMILQLVSWNFTRLRVWAYFCLLWVPTLLQKRSYSPQIFISLLIIDNQNLTFVSKIWRCISLDVTCTVLFIALDIWRP